MKSGSENFILGKVNLSVPDADALIVVVSPNCDTRHLNIVKWTEFILG